MEIILSKEREDLFERIRIDFLFSNPFLSVLALSLPTVFKTNQNALFETDGFRIYLDVELFEKYSHEEIKYQYAHVLLHIVLKHPSRMKTRDKNTWNLASDIVINLILDELKSVGEKPADEVVDELMKDLTVEEVYERLDKKDNGVGSKEEEQERQEQKLDLIEAQESFEKDEVTLDSTLVQALNIARGQGDLPSSMYQEIDTIIKPDINFADVFLEYLETSLMDRQSTYNRPNRRYIHQNIYLPGMENAKERLKIYIALDCSASIDEELYKKFLGVIKSVCGDYFDYDITVLPFDTKVLTDNIVKFKSYESDDESLYLIPKGNGGTNIDSVIEYINESHVERDTLLVVLSDGRFSFKKSLEMNMLFLISIEKNMEKLEPYGKVIRFSV